MNNKQLDIVSACADLLYNHRLPRVFLYEYLEETFKAKEWMEVFGFTCENDYKVKLSLPDEANVGSSCKFLEQICAIKQKEHDSGPWSIIDKMFIQDHKKNKYKVTRILNDELWRKLIKYSSCADIAHESGKLYNDSVLNTFSDSARMARFIKEFNIWYGERVKSGTNIILSCNPYDMLTASFNASFKSCYSPDGGCFNGTLATTASPNTFIATIEEEKRPGYKIGRAWVYVNDTIIILGRPYGVIDNAAIYLSIRNFLYGKIGGDWVHSPLRMGNGVLVLDGPGWMDGGYGDITVRKDMTLKEIHIVKPICLYCGNKYKDNSTFGICGTCARNIPRHELAE
jgi:hypothetical protein